MYKNRDLIADWDTLRLVLAIDRYGGLSGAAKHLGITHATVSRRLSKAESDAGIVFYERLPAGLRLTEIGRSVLEHAQRIEPELHALERQLLSHDTGLSGPLRVTIPPLMMTDAMSRDIADFAQMHPKVRLEFVGDNQPLNLHRREADVAIRVTHKPPETLWGRKLTDQHAGYYAATKWLQNNPVADGDFSQELPLISFSSWPDSIPKQLNQNCPHIHIIARSDDMVSAMQLVKAGLGITRMPRILGKTLPGISRIKSLSYEPYLPLWILTHADLRKTPRVEAFMRHIADRIQARRDTFCVTET